MRSVKTITIKGVWLKLPDGNGVKVGILSGADFERLISDSNGNIPTFFEELLPYFVDENLRRIKCANCYWQIIIDAGEARAVLWAAFGDNPEVVYAYREIFEIVYPNHTKAPSGSIVVTPDFDSHGRPIIVQLCEPENYRADGADGNPKHRGIFQRIYQKIFHTGRLIIRRAKAQ